MESSAVVTAATGRAVSLGIPPQPLRREWRAVSDHPIRTTGNEGQQQQGRDGVPVEFCAVPIDRNLGEDIMQQRLHDFVRRREELQRDEVELRAQIYARKEIVVLQKEYDAKMKEQINGNTKLQEKLLEMERTIHELERQLEQKEREIQAIQLDHEAAWAKEDLLREQSKELLTFRRERDNSEAERTQHLKQIIDLQEHFQEKERLYLELQEQHRIAQENILFKDEQLVEAQAWIARFQEMQSTSSHSLQNELRERTEQYNQLWISCQQQFSEMERIYMHTIHQLQLELASVKERSGSFPDESHLSQIKSKDNPQLGQNNGTQIDVNGSGTTGASYGPLSNGNSENVVINSSNQTEHVHGVPLAPPSLISMPTYLQPGQVPALHPFVMHHQGVHHSVPSHVAQSHGGHIHSIPTMSPIQQWQNHQIVSDASLLSNQHEYPSSQTEQNLIRSDINYDYDVSGNEQVVHAEFLSGQKIQGMEPNSSVHSSAEIDSADRSYLPDSRSLQSLQHISSQFNGLRLEPDAGNDAQEIGTNNLSKSELENKDFMPGQSNPIKVVMTVNNAAAPGADAFVSSEQNNSYGGGIITIDLLDERSLLACIVRTIPSPGSGGRIKISSTLPNRLGKMLAPLHWHDYKKKYGKLEEFLASHNELFVIEGDYIQVREGAQEMIAATAAVAKVAAAAKTVVFANPSVAVTPMAHSSQQRLKRTPSTDPNPTDFTSSNLGNGGNISGIKILSKAKDPSPQVLNGNESRLGQSSGLSTLANGVNHPNNSRSGANYVGKQQTRTSAVSMGSRRYS
ncbi:uncharacterized protein LOC124919984 isoform X2 [Impatiens glandulifera]|uniref:uncharacterized protein LOC124919984 isoform X2 n=1 Tax=Impatiens glandulifera TaxID=253017 RepID=UPI001FB134F3|nr:uncharacterized protein LOC124919984 isoform X2 [Impatiens glandulifera]